LADGVAGRLREHADDVLDDVDAGGILAGDAAVRLVEHLL
jgi:hypothetical protein